MDHLAANGVLQSVAKSITTYSPSEPTLRTMHYFKWCYAINNTLVKEKCHAWLSQEACKMTADKTHKVTVTL